MFGKKNFGEITDFAKKCHYHLHSTGSCCIHQSHIEDITHFFFKLSAEACWKSAYTSRIEKIDRTGDIVPFAFFGNFDDGPVANGWLRVSHRELDEEKSTPYQPVHKHTREVKLKAGEIVPVEIEILASSTLFERGERLQVVVQGSDIHHHPGDMHTMEHTATVNKGEHVIYTGGQYDSHLLVPVIPAD